MPEPLEGAVRHDPALPCQFAEQQRHGPAHGEVSMRLRIAARQRLQLCFSGRIEPARAARMRTFCQASYPRSAPGCYPAADDTCVLDGYGMKVGVAVGTTGVGVGVFVGVAVGTTGVGVGVFVGVAVGTTGVEVGTVALGGGIGVLVATFLHGPRKLPVLLRSAFLAFIVLNRFVSQTSARA